MGCGRAPFPSRRNRRRCNRRVAACAREREPGPRRHVANLRGWVRVTVRDVDVPHRLQLVPLLPHAPAPEGVEDLVHAARPAQSHLSGCAPADGRGRCGRPARRHCRDEHLVLRVPHREHHNAIVTRLRPDDLHHPGRLAVRVPRAVERLLQEGHQRTRHRGEGGRRGAHAVVGGARWGHGRQRGRNAAPGGGRCGLGAAGRAGRRRALGGRQP